MKELNREQIKERLSRVNYTQQDIADLTGVGISHVNKVIAGTRKSQRIVNAISVLIGEVISIRQNKQRRIVKPIHINKNLHEEIL